MQKKYSITEVEKVTTSRSLTTYLIKKPAIYLVWLFQDLPVSANQISITNLVLALMSIPALFILNSKILFILLLLASYLMDCIDGSWSRLKHQSSVFGDFLDRFVDYIKNFLIDLCFIVYYFNDINMYLKNPTVLLILIGLFFIVKGLFFIISDFKASIEPKFDRKNNIGKIINYGPAEKFAIIYPLAMIHFVFFVAYIVGYSYLYFTNIFIYLNKIQLNLNKKTNIS